MIARIASSNGLRSRSHSVSFIGPDGSDRVAGATVYPKAKDVGSVVVPDRVEHPSCSIRCIPHGALGGQ